MAKYTFQRIDTATRVRREELLARAPGWGAIDTTKPQFAIFDGDQVADWPLLDSYQEAANDCAEFNASSRDDDDGARSEALWQARMAGDMDA